MDTDSRAIPKSLSSLFAAPRPEYCQRCSDKVYYVEKVGPVNGVIFHKQCFKCATCAQALDNENLLHKSGGYEGQGNILWDTHPKGSNSGSRRSGHGDQGCLDGPQSWRKIQRANQRWTGPSNYRTSLVHSHPLAAQKGLGYKYKQQNQKHHFPAYVVSK